MLILIIFKMMKASTFKQLYSFMIIKLNWHRRVHFVQRLLLILHSEYLLGFFRLVLQVNFNICLILLMYLSFLCMVKKQMFWGDFCVSSTHCRS